MISNLDEIYNDQDLYSSKTMFSPPSERLPHVIRFELTKGCKWGRCTFCYGYEGIEHYVKDLEEYKEHIDKIWGKIGRKTRLAKSLERIFIGGNALEVETELLNKAILYTVDKFKDNTGRHPRRIALYGRTNDILKHKKSGLTKLYYAGNKWGKRWSHFFKNYILERDEYPYGLGMIYWGVESGSSEVLDYVRKGCTKKDIIWAAKYAKSLQTSVMIIPGLGGEKFYDDHVKETSQVLSKIKPRFLTFMGIRQTVNSDYKIRMLQDKEEGKNRPLTDRELAQQMIDIIGNMRAFRTKVGCFNSEIDKVGYNPLTFGSFNIFDSEDKDYLVKELKKRIKNIE